MRGGGNCALRLFFFDFLFFCAESTASITLTAPSATASRRGCCTRPGGDGCCPQKAGAHSLPIAASRLGSSPAPQPHLALVQAQKARPAARSAAFSAVRRSVDGSTAIARPATWPVPLPPVPPSRTLCEPSPSLRQPDPVAMSRSSRCAAMATASALMWCTLACRKDPGERPTTPPTPTGALVLAPVAARK